MIALAAAAWKFSIPSTVVKLSQLGFPLDTDLDLGRITRYIEDYEAPQSRFQELWDNAREYLPKVPGLNALLHNAGMRVRVPLHQWEKGFGQVVGGASAREVVMTYRPKIKNLNLPGVGGSDGAFKGLGWKDVLMVPFFDLPGRFRGGFYIGRDGQPGVDTVFKTISGYTASPNRKHIEAGLAFHPELLQPAGGPIVAVGDPYLYLRLQAGHYAQRTGVLPLVCWHDEGRRSTRHAWDMFRDRKIVFWAPALTAKILRQAVLSEGYLSITGRMSRKTTKQIQEYLHGKTPLEHLTGFSKRAKPWPTATAALLDRMDDSQIENLFLEYKLIGEHVNEVTRRLPPATADRVKTLLARQQTGTVVVIGGREIEESDDSWWVTSAGGQRSELISDAVLRIDRVVRHMSADKTFYHGRILHRGQVVPFTEPRKVVETSTFKWMQDTLIQENIGLMTYNNAWASKIMGLATQMHPPTLELGIESVGWDANRSTFELPEFTLPRSGNPVPQASVFPRAGTPGWGLPKPGRTSKKVLRLMSYDSESMRTFWALWGCVVANILAPAVGRPTRGIIALGESSAAIAHLVATSCGCLHEKLSSRRMAKILQLEQAHKWPIGVGLYGTAREYDVCEFLESSEEDRNCLLKADYYPAMTLMLNGGWHCVADSSEVTIDESIVLTAKQLLPSYLRSLAKRDFDLGISSNREVADAVLADAAEWVARAGMPNEAVLGAGKLLLANRDGRHANVFGEMVCKLLNDGRVHIQPMGYETEVQNAVFWKQDNGIFVPKATLAHVLFRRSSPDLNTFKVTTHLTRSKRLLSETPLNDQPGWLVDEQWLVKIQKGLQRRLSPPAKLHEG
jgi:hypothetical protein